MSERHANQPPKFEEESPRSELEAKRHEARQIAKMMASLSEVDKGIITGEDVADEALHYLYEICDSLVKRDLEMAALIVDALEAEPRATMHPTAWHTLRGLRKDLGLPSPQEEHKA